MAIFFYSFALQLFVPIVIGPLLLLYINLFTSFKNG